MIVPFDQIYNFLQQQIKEDVVIYQFYPPGSRKLSSLRGVRSIPSDDYCRNLSAKYIFLHDQEPLDFDLYVNPDKQEVRTAFQNNSNFWATWLEQHGLLDFCITRMSRYNINIFRDNTINDRWMLCHSEKNSKEVARYRDQGAVDVYWWSHALISRDWFRFAMVDTSLGQKNHDFQFDFNIYNRAWSGSREYRLKFTELVITKSLVDRSLIRFSPKDNGIHYQSHVYKNPNFRVTQDLEILPINDASSCASADYSSSDYDQISIDVVLETLVDDSRIHLTEKTLRPISCGKPFILVSTPGALDYLRSYGFRTFHDLIDESYDNIQDPLARLDRITDTMREIALMSTPRKNDLYRQMHLIAAENKKLFWSDDFFRKIIDEFRINYAQASAICDRYQQGSNWLANRRALAENYPEYRIRCTQDLETRSRRDLIQVLLKIQRNQRT